MADVKKFLCSICRKETDGSCYHDLTMSVTLPWDDNVESLAGKKARILHFKYDESIGPTIEIPKMELKERHKKFATELAELGVLAVFEKEILEEKK